MTFVGTVRFSFRLASIETPIIIILKIFIINYDWDEDGKLTNMFWKT